MDHQRYSEADTAFFYVARMARHRPQWEFKERIFFTALALTIPAMLFDVISASWVSDLLPGPITRLVLAYTEKSGDPLTGRVLQGKVRMAWYVTIAVSFARFEAEISCG